VRADAEQRRLGLDRSRRPNDIGEQRLVVRRVVGALGHAALLLEQQPPGALDRVQRHVGEAGAGHLGAQAVGRVAVRGREAHAARLEAAVAQDGVAQVAEEVVVAAAGERVLGCAAATARARSTSAGTTSTRRTSSPAAARTRPASRDLARPGEVVGARGSAAEDARTQRERDVVVVDELERDAGIGQHGQRAEDARQPGAAGRDAGSR